MSFQFSQTSLFSLTLFLSVLTQSNSSALTVLVGFTDLWLLKLHLQLWSFPLKFFCLLDLTFQVLEKRLTRNVFQV